MKNLMLIALVTLSVGTVSAADIDAGKAKSMTCVGCHGSNGISMVPMYPNLAGQKAPYLESSLQAYKSKQRAGGQAAVMYGMAAALSDEDIKNLAAYFASLDPSGQ